MNADRGAWLRAERLENPFPVVDFVFDLKISDWVPVYVNFRALRRSNPALFLGHPLATAVLNEPADVSGSKVSREQEDDIFHGRLTSRASRARPRR
jgi:hypothetical protein